MVYMICIDNDVMRGAIYISINGDARHDIGICSIRQSLAKSY